MSDPLDPQPESASPPERDDADAAIARALRSVEPPADLEARLLTAMRAARAQAEPPAQLEGQVIQAVRHTRAAPEETTPHWSRRRWLALAASAAVCAGGALWWRRQSQLPMARLTARLLTIVREGITLSLMSMDKAAVGEWLRAAHAPRAAHLIPKLDALGRKGCHLYQIEGHPVSLECILLANMSPLHFFTTPAAGLRDAPPPGSAPQVRTQAGLTVATWTHADQTIVLVSEESVTVVTALVA